MGNFSDNEQQFKIFPALDTDLTDLYNIYQVGNKFIEDLNPVDKDNIYKSFKFCFESRSPIFNYWKLIKGQDILGFGCLLKGSHNPQRVHICGEISIYMSKDNENKGHGFKKLYKHIISEASKNDLEFITAFMTTTNFQVIKGAERFGFRRIGELPIYKSYGHESSKVLYIKRLEKFQ